MLAFKLAIRNLLGAGLRTWLNVGVLSFAFVVIIFYNGLIDGWNRQGIKDTMEWEIGSGQFWTPGFDRYDPYTYTDAHQPLSGEIQQLIHQQKATPVLIARGTIYPQGRMQSVILKGIDPNQTILKLPTSALTNPKDITPAIIGKRMAKSAKLKKGDHVLLRWRDKNGTFDAREITISEIFNCDVPPADNGLIYLPLSTLQAMTDMKNEASILILGKDSRAETLQGWEYKSKRFLLKDFEALIQAKKGGGVVLQGLLLLIALLAIFDTQVLSIFRRQKEIGTYIALGMTRWQVVGLFTVEGAMHSILASLLGAAYGIPLFWFLNQKGITFGSPDVGITIAETIYPYYSLELILTTVLLVIISATIVSYIPARKISRMNPTEALRGKVQ